MTKMTEAAASEGGRIERSAGETFTAHFGSKRSYRFWGVYVARGRRALPFKVVGSVAGAAAGPTAVHLDGESEGGWAVYRLRMATNLLDARITEVLDALRAAGGAAP